MKIDKKKLVELLVEKTGMKKEAVESQLDQLISRIQGAARKGKALEIKGFGMFYFSKQGELKFDPSDELKTEVNHKYTGMDPVEIKKPRKSTKKSANDESAVPGDNEDSTGKSDRAWGFDEEADEEEQPSKQKKEVKEPEETSSTEESGEDAKEKHDIFAQFDHGSLSVTGKKKEKADKKSEPEKQEPEKADKKPDQPESKETGSKDTKVEPLEDASDKPDKKETKPVDTQETAKRKSTDQPKTQKKTPIKSTDKKQKNPAFTVLSVIIIILVVIIGIVVAFDLTSTDSASEQQESQADVMQMEPQPQSPAELPDEFDPAEETESPDDAPDAALQQPEEQEAREQADPPAIEDVEGPGTAEFGLFGTVIPIEDRHYSIILHSMRSEEIAQNLRNDLQDEGYRALIHPVDHEEHGTMWRVGIGQFETIPDAQSAAEELPQNYHDNHFIGLIQ
jgi:hypothetical protein